MPFKSEVQRKKFYAMASRGEMPRATVKKWEAHTPKGRKLPARLHKKASFLDGFLNEAREILEAVQKKEGRAPDKLEFFYSRNRLR